MNRDKYVLSKITFIWVLHAQIQYLNVTFFTEFFDRLQNFDQLI